MSESETTPKPDGSSFGWTIDTLKLLLYGNDMAHKLRIFLVRHAVSAANLDREVNKRLPDNQVPLTDIGHEQATASGKALVEYLKKETGRRRRILCSPYLRTRETCSAIEQELISNNLEYDKREDIALREISFGLFDGIADEELPNVFPLEHAHYQKYVDFEGEFYAPMPMGESRAQVADRVKPIFGTILRDSSYIDDFIIVSHGVTLRAFQMQWLHKSPEWFQEQINPQNASISLIESDGINPYSVSTVFDGFPYDRSKQAKRENG